MKNFKIIVIAILVTSLTINLFLLSKMNAVEERVQSISYYQSDIIRSVEQQSSSIYHTMEAFKREQSWISSIEMFANHEAVIDNNSSLRFNWQIKELLTNSEVAFHFKYGEDEDYRTVAANNLSDGLFEAKIPVEVPLAPEWYVMTHVNSRDKRIIEEQNRKNHDQGLLSYYVTVTNDDLVKSSTIVTTNVSYLGTNLYGAIDVFIDINDDGYHVSVTGSRYYQEGSTFLNEAYLMKYDNDQIIDEEKLATTEVIEDPSFPVQEYGSTFYRETNNEKLDYTRLVLKAVYHNGEVFEKEIYSKEK